MAATALICALPAPDGCVQRGGCMIASLASCPPSGVRAGGGPLCRCQAGFAVSYKGTFGRSLSGIDDYRMRVRLQGDWFAGSASIEVRNGVPVSITPVEHGNVGADSQVVQHYDTVDEMFGVIERAIEQKTDRLDVKYNETLGNPIDVYVDHANVIDEEHGFVVEDFQVLR